MESTMIIGVVRESQPGETRVAATPTTVKQLRQLGYEVVVESGAGDRADFPDQGLIRESGTQGYPIRRVALETSNLWRAYLSDVYIFIVDDLGNLVGKYPFVSGFPGKVNAIKWVYVAGGPKYLFVATDQGLVYKTF